MAAIAWAVSAILAVGAVAVMASVNFVRDFVPIGLALTTTALGTLLPILHDHSMLQAAQRRAAIKVASVPSVSSESRLRSSAATSTPYRRCT